MPDRFDWSDEIGYNAISVVRTGDAVFVTTVHGPKVVATAVSVRLPSDVAPSLIEVLAPRPDPVDDERLYGLPDAEVLYFDPAAVYESEIDPHHDPDGPPRYEVEEFTVHPPRRHLPPAEALLDWVAEWTADNGEITEGIDDTWLDASRTPAAVAAAEVLLDTIAAAVRARMANEKIATHVLTFDDDDEPLYDGAPLYRPAVS